MQPQTLIPFISGGVIATIISMGIQRYQQRKLKNQLNQCTTEIAHLRQCIQDENVSKDRFDELLGEFEHVVVNSKRKWNFGLF